MIGRSLLQAWALPVAGWPAPSEVEHKAAGLLALVTDLREEMPAAGLAVDQALRFAEARLEARDPAREVVVHGDPHAENLLRVARPRTGAAAGYVFVDPDGFRCEAEYDVGVVLRDWNGQLGEAADPQATLRAWCARLARTTGLDAEAIWQWAFLERVSTGLYLARHGMRRDARPFLDVATRLLERDP